MCIIVYNPFGNKLNKELMRVAYDNNPHGFGIIWLDDDNQASYKKDIVNFNTFWKTLRYLEGYSYAFHLRWKTKGEINSEQCHPFQVLNKSKHNIDLFMMHNGTITDLHDNHKSDTQLFSELLKDIYETNYYNRPISDFLNFIEGGKTTIGSFNKLLFLTNDFRVKIINKSEGFTNNDVWYSNSYSFIEKYREKRPEKTNNPA